MNMKFPGTILLDGKGNRIPSPELTIGENGEIKSIKGNQEAADGSTFLLPGFIDTHIHGADGADVMDGTAEALETISACLPREGTTSFLATTLTASPEKLQKALKVVKESKNLVSGAEILGVHLEGPFINEAKKGAQPEEWIRRPDSELFQLFQKKAGGNIRTVTAAPEMEKADLLLEQCRRTGVIVSAGHTDASCAEMEKAIRQGVSQVTHMFNGMRGIHHRDPGTAGAALLRSELRAELIADGIHVSPEAVKLVYKNKGAEGILLITDAMRAKGRKDGEYELGGQRVTVSRGEALLEDGTLAGSVLKMNEAAANMMQFTGCTMEEIVQMASVNPAEVHGLQGRKGVLAPGSDADFILIDADWNVLETYTGGKRVYRKEEEA